MTTGIFCGLATLDVVSHVERAPGPDEKVTATWQLLAGGGPALNAAVVFAALGGDAVLISRVGQGPAADLIRADLAACGVRLVDLAGPGGTPPVSSITVEADGGRRVVGLDATAPAPQPRDESPDAAQAVAQELSATCPAVVLVDGHHPDLARHVLDRRVLDAADLPRVLDAGRWKPPMAELIPSSTHVLASSDFRLDGQDDDGVTARVGALLSRMTAPCAVAGVTAGGGAITWRSSGDDGEDAGAVTPPAVDVVDTLGAGDALHGAYAWALATGHPDPLQVATRVASGSCTVRGTRDWLDEAARWVGENATDLPPTRT